MADVFQLQLLIRNLIINCKPGHNINRCVHWRHRVKTLVNTTAIQFC